MKEIFSYTYAICVECDAKIQARIIAEDNRVYLEKCCPEHGISQELISSDADWYNKSRNYVKPKQLPLDYKVKSFVSCPESCGSCSEHQQHTCLPVIEITQKCNLDCPVCLKDLDKTPNVSVEEFTSIIDDLLRYEGKVDVINISGVSLFCILILIYCWISPTKKTLHKSPSPPMANHYSIVLR